MTNYYVGALLSLERPLGTKMCPGVSPLPLSSLLILGKLIYVLCLGSPAT